MKRLSIWNILVPIDFSKMSIQAIEIAKRLAQRFGATIHLAHVHQFAYPAEFMGPVLSPGQLPESFEEHRAKQLAEELKTVASKSGLSPREQTHLRTGASAFDEICTLAREIPADLIVMPTHGRTGLKHIFLGSTAERVVQHSPCPVFVARQKKRQSKTGAAFTISTILVPVDFSDCSLDGLHYAIAFADSVAATLILFHAIQLASYTSGGFAYDLSSLEDAAQKDAERQMQKFVRMAKFGGVKFQTAITMGPPMPEICTFAEEKNVDLIITSTHGLTGFKHILIGSNAEHVVRHAPCSVLVVPSHPTIRMANLPKPGGRKTRETTSQRRQPRKSMGGKSLTKRDRKLAVHAFPERRKTNKFRESDLSR